MPRTEKTSPDAARVIADAIHASKNPQPEQEEFGGPIPKAEANPEQKRRRVKMELLVTLDDEALLAISRRGARLHADLSAHKSRATAVKAKLKDQQATLENDIATIARTIETGEELREVDVDEIIDFATNSYVEIRLDTGAEIPGSRRALSLSERQRELGLPMEEKRKSDFTAPKDPVNAAIESELTGDFGRYDSNEAEEDDDEA